MPTTKDGSNHNITDYCAKPKLHHSRPTPENLAPCVHQSIGEGGRGGAHYITAGKGPHVRAHHWRAYSDPSHRHAIPLFPESHVWAIVAALALVKVLRPAMASASSV
jgi:hypothetical protein